MTSKLHILPGVEVIRSSFGGGWAVPLDAAGAQALHEFFGEEPAPLAPLGGEKGYIFEPWQAEDLAEHLRSCSVAWAFPHGRAIHGEG